MTIKAELNQSFWDIALILTGNASNAVQIASYNNMSVTDNPAGLNLSVPDRLEINIGVKNIYDKKKIKPVTGYFEQHIFTNQFDYTFE